jgi:galactokinase
MIVAEKEEFVRTIRHNNKVGVKIRKVHYEAIKTFILTALKAENTLPVSTLISIAHEAFEPSLKAETGWFLYNVKLDLEARGLIKHKVVDKKEKQVMILKKEQGRTMQNISTHSNVSNYTSDIQVNHRVRNKFIELFQRNPLIVHAPGRINLIGEHTDYNNGFVMPAAIDKGIQFAISTSSSETLIYSLNYKQFLSIDLNNIQPSSMEQWHNYLLGVIFRLKETGHVIKPFFCVFEGDLPSGAGLSSSAAMECGFVMALNSVFDLGLSPLEMIHIAQWSEHHFVGVKCGIMDQFASTLGKADHVIQLDCRSLKYNYYPLELGKYCILLCDTNVKHSLATSEYNTRRNECDEGVSIIQKYFPDVRSLRDVDIQMLVASSDNMPGNIYKRCKYIIEENQRVLEASTDLQKGDLTALGKKMYETHEGLSALYQVSCPELDFLVDIAKRYEGIAGSRMMGGGFGGCTISIIEIDLVGTFVVEAKAAYKQIFNRDLSYHIVKTGDGVKIIEKP